MNDPCFDLLHWFASLDCRRTGNAPDALPGRLHGIAQVWVGLGDCLAFHVLIVANQVANRQVAIPNKHGRSRN